ncbi:hypothetical protein JCM19037_2207 [Geomicrobium sp. JCM 19037]|uniref:hypothetical protein n=1 Tax=Geomicrobium sp. JCM 19037 TaxID=1460634 RepID=UPI00045F1A79|nr:hypothetical protein [Geomicrobium sp. JCM 19037]GAK03851.1 hypothetical protein JCM19037_2207 [Geomicrobium sp. JCM 19037]
MALAEEMKHLQQVTNDEGVLTIYLNTDFANQNQHRGEWKIRLKNGSKRLVEYAEKSEDKEQVKQLKRLLDEVETYIQDKQAEMQRSLVIIASADGSLWSATCFKFQ